jgi:hypothetical protein
MGFHIPSFATMNDALAFSRFGSQQSNSRTFSEEWPIFSDRSRPKKQPSLKGSSGSSERVAIQTERSADKFIDPTARMITPDRPKADDFWTTAGINCVDGRDIWTVDAPHQSVDDEGLAFFCFDLEAPRDIGFTMSMRAADPGPSAFEIVVTGHVISRHYTVVDRFISRTFVIPSTVLNAGRNALSISAIPGYHGIWIESAGIGPLA